MILRRPLRLVTHAGGTTTLGEWPEEASSTEETGTTRGLPSAAVEEAEAAEGAPLGVHAASLPARSSAYLQNLPTTCSAAAGMQLVRVCSAAPPHQLVHLPYEHVCSAGDQ